MTARGTAEDAARDAHHSARGGTLHRLGQLGFAAQGVVWLVLGWIALRLAIGAGASEEATTSGAIEQIGSSTAGRVLLVVMALALLGYVAWQVVLAALGHPDEQGRSDTVRRIASGAKALVALVFAITAVLVVVRGSAGSGETEERGAATLLSTPGGQWLLGAVGLAVLALGAWWLWTGLSARFTKKLEPDVPRGVVVAGRVGHAARGVAFVVLGSLVILAAVRADPAQAGGTDTALTTILGWPAGPFLLGAVAVGLMLFGVYQILAARHVLKD